MTEAAAPQTWPVRPGYITADQAHLIMRARDQVGLSDEELTALLATSSAATRPEDMTTAEFDLIMDKFIGWGFRHPGAPILSERQLLILDEGRCRLGLDRRDFVGTMRSLGVRGHRHLDGINFLVMHHVFNLKGAELPLPHGRWMSGEMVGLLHRLVHRHHVEPKAFQGALMELGGVGRASFLDQRGFVRIVSWLERAHDAQPPVAPPRMPDTPGLATQAQANLIWGLWTRYGGLDGKDRSEATLDQVIAAAIGLPGGGLVSLTRAGARKVLDRFLPYAAAARDGGDAVAAMQAAHDGDRPSER